MRIAIFTDTYLPQINGVSHTLSQLINYLQEEGHEYLLFAPRFDGNSDNQQIKRSFSTPFFLYPECRISFPNIYKIKEAIKSFQPEVIQLMTEFNMGMIGAKLGKRYEIPTISNYSTHFSSYLKYYHLHMFENLAWSYFKWFHNYNDLTLCPSNETKKALLEKGIKRVAIFTRGIDSQQFTPRVLKKRGTWPVRLLYVGRVSPEKDLDILLKSYSGLRNVYGDKIALTVVGDGPLLEQYKERYGTICTFTGYQKGEALSRCYQQADIFTFPSSTETFGNVVLEAMASGLPVIGASAGGVQENVKHQQNGLLCEPRNVEAYRTAIETLFLDEKKRHNMGDIGRNMALNRTWAYVFDDLINRYASIVNEKQNRKIIA